MEYTKVARQRAETGARLRVIRELTNMPTAFSADDAKKPLVFGRFAQNTDYILQTKEGRAMASAQALGVDVASLFGGRKIETEEKPAQIETAPAAALPEAEIYEDVSYEGAEEAFDSNGTENLAEKAAQIVTEDFDSLTQTLRGYCETYKEKLDGTLKTGVNPYKMAMEELDPNNFNASVETRKAMIQRIKDFLKIRGIAL